MDPNSIENYCSSSEDDEISDNDCELPISGRPYLITDGEYSDDEFENHNLEDRSHLPCKFSILTEYLIKDPEKIWEKVVHLSITMDRPGSLNFLRAFPNLMHLEIRKQRTERMNDVVFDIEGIENCVNLLTLNMEGIDFRSFCGIEYCSKLKLVKVFGPFNTKIFHLMNLPKLRKIVLIDVNLDVCLEHNNWSNYPNLDTLVIHECHMSDDKYLKGINVEILSIIACALKSLKDIEFENVKELSLCHTLIRDITPLRNATKLTHLTLCSNKLKSLDPINHLLEKDTHINIHNSYDGDNKLVKLLSEKALCRCNDHTNENPNYWYEHLNHNFDDEYHASYNNLYRY
jgi:hypothetical protein